MMRSLLALLVLALLVLTGASWAGDSPHWAFQPVRPVPVPAIKDTDWVRNPIDAFLLARLEAKGWRPAPAVTPAVLLRRTYLDLLGLPPTLEEQDAFLRETSPDAHERLVGRLLASPAHAERFARHWLDVARYADTNGYERDADKPGAWAYRDRVIRAFDADLGFDRFLVEQLAGDELDDATSETMLSTGFLRLGPWDDEPADPKADRHDQLDDVLSATCEAFLGLTLACARCHDHKFEPLSQRDYYRMVALFDPLQRPRNGRTELDRPALPPRQRARFRQIEAELAHLGRGKTAVFLAGPGAGSALRGRMAALQATLAASPRGYFLEETSPAAPVTHLLKRGRADSPGAVVLPGVPTILGKLPLLPPGEFSTRRRLSLARWLTRPDHPLTARVIVNRVWMWHFGEGLVRTPSDFGTRGQAPTHPELLDWLAGWFVDHGWSLKKLHRLILTSNAYRMSKRQNPEYAASDPENRLWWRFPYRRLEAEVLRDSILAVTGQLDQARFGPGVRPAIPAAALEGHSDPRTVWQPDSERVASRRTIYVHVKRSLLVPMLEALDFCDTTRSSARRSITTVAPQALILFNGEFTNQQARYLADQLRRDTPDATRRIDRAYRILLARSASRVEQRLLLESLRHLQASGLSEPDAWQQVCRVLLNLNEFAYPE